jgi:hypothetical protein
VIRGRPRRVTGVGSGAEGKAEEAYQQKGWFHVGFRAG